MLVLRFSLGLVLLLGLLYLIMVSLAVLGTAFRLIFTEQARTFYLINILFFNL